MNSLKDATLESVETNHDIPLIKYTSTKYVLGPSPAGGACPTPALVKNKNENKAACIAADKGIDITIEDVEEKETSTIAISLGNTMESWKTNEENVEDTLKSNELKISTLETMASSKASPVTCKNEPERNADCRRDRKENDVNIKDIKGDETATVAPKPQKKRSKPASLLRVYIRHIKKEKRNVHPSNRPVSPQIITEGGKMVVWNPEHNSTDKLNSDEEESLKRQNPICCRCSTKEKLQEIRLDGKSIPLLREAIKEIEGSFGNGVGSVFTFTRWLIIHNICLSIIWGCFIIIPAAVFFDYKMPKKINLKFENIIEGNGPLQHLWIFYGNYPARYRNYRIDMAYVILSILTYFGTLFLILRSIAKAELTTKGNPLSLLLFASWDYSVKTKSDRESLKADLSVQAKDILSEARTKEEAIYNRQKGALQLFAIRSLAWLISITLTAGACFMIYFFLNEVTVATFVQSNTGVNFGQGFLETNGLSLLFSFINIVFPTIIEKLVIMEGYHKVELEIRVNVIRVFLLRFLSIIALMFTLYSTVSSESFKGCGGTFIGQEFYRIIFFDIAFVNFTRLLLKGLWYILRRKKKEPNVSALVLQVIYRQALIWSGTFFCPIIPILGIVSMTMVFYTNYFLFKKTCKAPTKRFRNNGTSAFYKTCVAFTLGVLLVPVVTILGSDLVSIGGQKIGNVTSSCGPFNETLPLDVLKEITNKKNPNWLFQIFHWFTSTATFPIFIILSTIVYVQTVRLAKHRQRFKDLRIDHIKFKTKSNARLLKASEGV